MGDKPVNNFRMVERHFFRKKLLKSFDFNFGFVIPDSKNTCEHLYEFPHLSAADRTSLLSAHSTALLHTHTLTQSNSLTPTATRPAPGEDMIANPYETKSDSFYFVDGKLVMHNKAEYAYTA